MYVEDKATPLNGWFDTIGPRQIAANVAHDSRPAVVRHHAAYRTHLLRRHRQAHGLGGMDGWFSNVWASIKPSAVIKKTIQIVPKPQQVLQTFLHPTAGGITNLLKTANPLMMTKNIISAQGLLPHQIMSNPGFKQGPSAADIAAQQAAAQAAYDAQFAKDQAAAQAAYDAQQAALYAQQQAAAKASAQYQPTDTIQPVSNSAPQPDYSPTASSSAGYAFAPTDTTGYTSPASNVAFDSGQPADLPVPETNPAMTVVSTPGSVSYVDDFTNDYAYGSGNIAYEQPADTTDTGDSTMQGFGAVTPAAPAATGTDWGGIFSGLVGAWQQKKLVDMNIERMKAGQPPLDVASSGVGAQVTVNMAPAVKNALMIGGVGLLGIGAYLLLRKKGRR
jgi:hypothetical protein